MEVEPTSPWVQHNGTRVVEFRHHVGLERCRVEVTGCVKAHYRVLAAARSSVKSLNEIPIIIEVLNHSVAYADKDIAEMECRRPRGPLRTGEDENRYNQRGNELR